MWVWFLAAFLLVVIWVGGYFFLSGWSSLLTWQIIATIVVVLMVAGVLIWRRMRAVRAAKSLEREIMRQAQQQAANTRPDRRAEIVELQEQIQKGIASLKASKMGVSGASALYALPWYVIIGPPGAGKTTALKHSGLEFPFLDPRGGGVRGVGGTRNCDWWFTNEAILLDTAGRYATEADDHDEWLAFLGFLRKYRPQKPINGILVAISLADLAQATEEGIDGYAKKLRARIDEVMTRLEMVVPVYVMFTKSDLIAGFAEFFGDLRKSERGQTWGATFSLDPGAEFKPNEAFEREFDLLVETLHARTIKRLGTERNQDARQKVFQFPLEFQSLRANLSEFVNILFEKSAFTENPIFRGIYFTSGTQEGRPMDRILGAMARAFGLRPAVAEASEAPKESKSYFVTDLFRKVAFPDRDVAGRTVRETKRQQRVRILYAAAAVLLAIMLIIPSTVTYLHNRTLVDETRSVTDQAKAVDWNGPGEPRDKAASLDAIRREVDKLQRLSADTPVGYSWGMFVGDRLREPLNKVYLASLQKGLRDPTKEYLESRLAGWRDTPADKFRGDDKLWQAAFDDLKLYLMMTGGPEEDRDGLGDDRKKHLDVPDSVEPVHYSEIVRAMLPPGATNETCKDTGAFSGGDPQQVPCFAPEHLTLAWAKALLWKKKASTDSVPADLRDALAPHARQYLQLWKSPETAWVGDDALIRAVRSRLNEVPTINRDLALVKKDVDPSITAITKDDVFSRAGFGQYVDSKSAEANGKPVEVDPAFTFKGWCSIFRGLKDFKDRIARESWVLGSTDRKDEIAAQQVEDRYYKQYDDAWDAFLKDFDVHEPENNQKALEELTALNEQAPEWPYLKLIKTVRDNTVLDENACTAPSVTLSGLSKDASDAKKAAQNAGKQAGVNVNVNTPVTPSGPNIPMLQQATPLASATVRTIHPPEAYFGQFISFAISDPGDGKTPPPPAELGNYQGSVVSKLIALLTEVEAANGAPPDPTKIGGEYTTVYRIVAEELGKEDTHTREILRPLLMNPIELSWKAVLKDAGQASSGLWEVEVYPKYFKTLDNLFPFNPDAQIDAKLEDFVNFFKPHTGLLWAFYEKHVQSQLEIRGDSFVPVQRFNSSISYNTLFRDKCLKKALEITRAVWPDEKSELPAVQFEVNLHSVSPDVASVLLSIDGIEREYKNEPEEWILMQWPPKEAKAHGASIRARGYAGLDETIDRPGDFGFFRLLAAAYDMYPAPNKAGEQPSMIGEWTLRSESSVVRLNLRPLKTTNPIVKNVFKELRCPKHIVTGKT